MANEIRLRANNISGTTTDNPLAIGATTINSPGFVDLPVVNTTNHLILILDPLEVNGAAEIVQVTAHTAASSVCTIIRGFESTTPRQHNLGTTWFHGPVVSDFAPTPVPACRVFHSIDQSLLDATETTLAFNSERYDNSFMHDNAVLNSRITFPIAGVYLVTGHVELTLAADYVDMYLMIRVNGAGNGVALERDAGPGTLAATRFLNVSTAFKFAANDYVELRCYQDNSASAARNAVSNPNRSTEFSATYLAAG